MDGSVTPKPQFREISIAEAAFTGRYIAMELKGLFLKCRYNEAGHVTTIVPSCLEHEY